MRDAPKISLIIPVYNVEKHITRGLESLKNQTYNNFEVIIVDDCGTDKSIAMAEPYCNLDTKFKIIRNEKNLGTFHARRVGVEAASGKYIVFFDPDDELQEKFIEKVNDGSMNDPDIIFTEVCFTRKFKWYEKKPYNFPSNTSDSLLISYFSNGRGSYLWGTPGKIYKREFLEKVYTGLDVDIDFRFVYAEDVFLFLNAMLLDPNYTCIRDGEYVYHSNDTSITNEVIKLNDAKIIQYDYIFDSICEKLKHFNFNKKEKKMVKFIIAKLEADKYLLLRHSDGFCFYMKCIFLSFIRVPTLSKAVRALACILSFGMLKL